MTATVDGAGAGGYILAGSHTIPPETPDEKYSPLRDGRDQRQEIMDRAADIRARLRS